MPPAYVKTIREEIINEYTKLVLRSTYGSPENRMYPHFKYQT